MKTDSYIGHLVTHEDMSHSATVDCVFSHIYTSLWRLSFNKQYQ